MRARMARAAPTISSTVSPFMRSADQQAADLRRRRLAVHDEADHLGHLVGAEILAQR